MTGTCYQVDWDLFPACRNEGPSCQTVEAFDVIVLIAVVSMLLLFPNNADRLQEDALSKVSFVASSPAESGLASTSVELCRTPFVECSSAESYGASMYLYCE